MPEWPGLTLALRMPLCCLLWQGSRGSSGSCCAADPGSGSSAAAITVENPAVGRTFRPKLLRSLTVLGDAARDEGPGFKEMEQLISPLHKKRKDEGGGGRGQAGVSRCAHSRRTWADVLLRCLFHLGRI